MAWISGEIVKVCDDCWYQSCPQCMSKVQVFENHRCFCVKCDKYHDSSNWLPAVRMTIRDADAVHGLVIFRTQLQQLFGSFGGVIDCHDPSARQRFARAVNRCLLGESSLRFQVQSSSATSTGRGSCCVSTLTAVNQSQLRQAFVRHLTNDEDATVLCAEPQTNPPPIHYTGRKKASTPCVEASRVSNDASQRTRTNTTEDDSSAVPLLPVLVQPRPNVRYLTVDGDDSCCCTVSANNASSCSCTPREMMAVEAGSTRSPTISLFAATTTLPSDGCDTATLSANSQFGETTITASPAGGLGNLADVEITPIRRRLSSRRHPHGGIRSRGMSRSSLFHSRGDGNTSMMTPSPAAMFCASTPMSHRLRLSKAVARRERRHIMSLIDRAEVVADDNRRHIMLLIDRAEVVADDNHPHIMSLIDRTASVDDNGRHIVPLVDGQGSAADDNQRYMSLIGRTGSFAGDDNHRRMPLVGGAESTANDNRRHIMSLIDQTFSDDVENGGFVMSDDVENGGFVMSLIDKAVSIDDTPHHLMPLVHRTASDGGRHVLPIN